MKALICYEFKMDIKVVYYPERTIKDNTILLPKFSCDHRHLYMRRGLILRSLCRVKKQDSLISGHYNFIPRLRRRNPIGLESVCQRSMSIC